MPLRAVRAFLMCVYHGELSGIADEMTFVSCWPIDLEEQARLTLINIEGVLVGFVGLVVLMVLYGLGLPQ